jgi:putative transposase
MNPSTEDRNFYRRKLPHYRIPGATYHVRFSVYSSSNKLTKPSLFKLVESSLLFGHKKSYLLFGYVIMPNHCHMVIQPLPKSGEALDWLHTCEYQRLESIIGSIKHFTSLQINRLLHRSGHFWEEEYFDRIIRNDKDLELTVDYIHHNPIRWNLVKLPEDYRWSSLRTIYSGRNEYAGWFEYGLNRGEKNGG